MLVLSRKMGESIQIADNISITISRVCGGRVRLSIDAPQSVRVVRKELLLADSGHCDEDAPSVAAQPL